MALGLHAPITAVRRQYAGIQIKSWNGTIDGATWIPYLATPAHPDYLSGHATFSGAAAEVLTRMLGSDDFGARVTIPAGRTVPGSGPGPATAITIGSTRWSEMAIDSGNSRNWAGIHFVDANRHGSRWAARSPALPSTRPAASGAKQSSRHPIAGAPGRFPSLGRLVLSRLTEPRRDDLPR
jgi:vanadium-dependent haloperoxidase-like protein